MKTLFIKCFSTLVLIVLLISACSAKNIARQTPRLNVYAAASLTDAFTEISRDFEAENPNTSIALNFGGSQNLRTQIEQGAPADVFASANLKEMDALIKQGLVISGEEKVFLTNQLIVILPQSNPAQIERLEDLGKPGLKIVLAAEDVPAGKYARQILDSLSASFGADYKDRVLANVVSNEDNIKQALAKVHLGEADASIVYVSDAIAVPDLKRIEIPAEFNVIAEYPIASPSGSKLSELAKKFIAYVLSSKGQATLKKWGFTPVAP